MNLFDFVFILILSGVRTIRNVVICMAHILQGTCEEIAYATVFQNRF